MSSVPSGILREIRPEVLNHINAEGCGSNSCVWGIYEKKALAK